MYDEIFSLCIIDSVGTPSLASLISDIKFNDLSVKGLSEVVIKLLKLVLLNKSPPDWPSKLTSLELSYQDIGCVFTCLIKLLAKYALPFLLRCNFFLTEAGFVKIIIIYKINFIVITKFSLCGVTFLSKFLRSTLLITEEIAIFDGSPLYRAQVFFLFLFFFSLCIFSQVRNIPERIILISTTGLR